jgi:hypothetical protein
MITLLCKTCVNFDQKIVIIMVAGGTTTSEKECLCFTVTRRIPTRWIGLVLFFFLNKICTDKIVGERYYWRSAYYILWEGSCEIYVLRAQWCMLYVTHEEIQRERRLYVYVTKMFIEVITLLLLACAPLH